MKKNRKVSAAPIARVRRWMNREGVTCADIGRDAGMSRAAVSISLVRGKVSLRLAVSIARMMRADGVAPVTVDQWADG